MCKIYDKNEKKKHLIIFDEIQEYPDAVNSLKYFCEDANDYHVVAAGSLLGTLLSELIVGGLPECVASRAEEKNSGTVLQIQKEFLSMYENDISKHYKKIDAGRILLMFKSLVTQLSKENEKFIYGCIKQGARAREFEVSIEWLQPFYGFKDLFRKPVRIFVL